MYEIEGWTNNAGSGNLNYQEPFNYVPSGYSYSGGDQSRELTQSWGGGEAVDTSSGGWSPVRYSSSPSTTNFPDSTTKYVGGGGGTQSSFRGVSGSPAYQYIAPQLLGSTSTTSYSGGGPLPTMTAPTFNLPTYDYGRINYLAQQQAAPLYTKARNALTTGIGKIASVDNPYMQGQARKQLMSGYGGGLSEIAAGAARTGAQLYAPEYAGQMQKAGAEYSGELATRQANFQAALAEWQKSLVQTTTTSNQYSSPSSFNTYTGQTGSTSGQMGTGYMLHGKFTPFTSPGYGDERDLAYWNQWKAMIPAGAVIR